MDLVQLMLGVALLYLGGEGLVRGAAALGRRYGLSSMVIGLTIVSVGTSSPELAATLAGTLKGVPAVSFGNVVGSNIANLGLVLGLISLIWPLRAAARFLGREMPFMLLTSASTFWLVLDGEIGRFEGLFLLAVMFLYLKVLLGRQEEPQVEEQFDEAYRGRKISMWASLLAVLAGIGLLVAGAHFMIQGAVGLARSIGVSERVIGLTVVAFGTSLPELASSVVAASHREGDIVLGNLIGSNIFNILLILGVTALVRPVSVETSAVWADLVAMMAVSLVAWLFLHTGNRLARPEGLALAAMYCAYLVYLFA